MIRLVMSPPPRCGIKRWCVSVLAMFTDSKLPSKWAWCGWRDPISKFRNALNISQTVKATFFQIWYTGSPRRTWLRHHFQGQKVKGQGRGQLVFRVKMYHQFVADISTLFEFRILTGSGQFLFIDCKLHPKWAWRGWRDQFWNFATLSIFRKRLKPRFSNLVHR